MNIPTQSTVKLTHFGRKSSKSYTVKIWYVVIDGDLWIGSIDGDKNWVKNLRASGEGAIDFGLGEIAVTAEYTEDPLATSRHKVEVRKKYPVMSRLIDTLFGRGKTRVAFRLRPK